MKSHMCLRIWLAFVFALILSFPPPLAAKRRDDVVIMKNGDRFTGEIRGLRHGQLIFKSSYMSQSVSLDWDQVETLQSSDRYVIALTNGKRITGVMEETRPVEGSTKGFTIVAPTSTLDLSPSEVVGIEPRGENFLRQLNGSIDYGFSLTSANTHINSSLGANAAYVSSKNTAQVSTSSQFDGQSTGATANRFTFDSQYGRFFTPNWAALGLFSVLKSNQQDLNLRSTYGAGLGRQLARTDKTAFSAIAGAVYTHERYFPQSGLEPVRNNAESVFGFQVSTFRFRTLDMNSRTLVFPSITDPGRVRLETQSNIHIELIRNFFWGFQVYENYDSRPPVNARKNDLGLNTTFGWKFP